MYQIMRFDKTADSRWYADLIEWTGDKEDLEMVMGADTMLDIMCEGNNYVLCVVAPFPFQDADRLERLVICGDKDLSSQGGPSYGAYYKMKSYRGIEFNLQIWLCDVVKFVFGSFPKDIYISVKSN